VLLRRQRHRGERSFSGVENEFAYLSGMRKSAFEPCIPTKATKVPDRPEWIHEIKHDGCRLFIQRDGQRVRLFTRNGHDWIDRFPLITEAALRNRCSSARNWKRSADGFSRRTCWTARVRAFETRARGSCKV
jgi:hypothetical protein